MIIIQWAIVLFQIISLTQSLYFHISETERKCFIEEIPDETLVIGKYKVELFDAETNTYLPSTPGIGTHVEVKDPDEKIILSKLYTSEGRFTFTSHTPGEHVICLFTNSSAWFGSQKLRVHLDIDIGEHAIDYQQVSAKEKLTELQLRVRQLLDQVEQIRKEQTYQRYREERFRETSESTNQRVLWWSLAQLLVLVIAGFWQMRHLKGFFEAKKLTNETMLARGVRNVIYNYTDAQRKVRSATSNDAWGPSPALMHEIADLTDNVVAYAEIMPIIWKRLNDHGKNWRHVYKSLVLLDHLIKYGNERVAQQCKENIFAIQTLKDFQYIEDQKDQGFNVREKAKQLVALLRDDERLRNERRKAQDARERYARQAMGMDSTGAVTYGRTTSSTSVRRNSAETSDPSYFSTNNVRSSSFNENLHSVAAKDFGQPSNAEEEQLQMQIALAESQREAEAEERRRKNDELKLKIALERSVNEASPDAATNHQIDASLFDNQTPFLSATTASNIGWNPRPATHLGFTTTSNDPWSTDSNGQNSESLVNNDPWSTTTKPNPWGETRANDNGLSINVADPWGLGNPSAATIRPASPPKKPIDNELSEFFGASATISIAQNPWNVSTSQPQATSISPTILQPTNGNTSDSHSTSPYPPTVSSTSRKTPESFLGDKFSTLVDLNQLVTQPKTTNPFGSTAPRAANPFANANKPPTLEQLSSSNNIGFSTTSSLPPPLIPSSFNGNNISTPTNPFM